MGNTECFHISYKVAQLCWIIQRLHLTSSTVVRPTSLTFISESYRPASEMKLLNFSNKFIEGEVEIIIRVYDHVWWNYYTSKKRYFYS